MPYTYLYLDENMVFVMGILLLLLKNKFDCFHARELLDDYPLEIRMQMYFQHNVAPAHFARQVSQHLDERFSGRRIGRGSFTSWPPLSQGLTQSDYIVLFLDEAESKIQKLVTIIFR